MPRESVTALRDRVAKQAAEIEGLKAANYAAVSRASTAEVVNKSLREERDNLTKALIECRKAGAR